MATTRSIIDQNVEKIQTAERLMKNAKMRTNGLGDGTDDPVPIYELTRITASGPVTWTATESETVKAGDVLRVTLFYPNRRREGASTEAAPVSPPLSGVKLTSERRLVTPAPQSR
jgi:hypothetical protein